MTVRTANSAIVKAAAILAGTIPLMAWRRRRDADETGRGSECHVGVETTLALAGDGRSTPISPNVHQGRRGCARRIHIWPVIPPNNSGLDPEVAAITFEVMIGALRPDLKREDQQTLARVFLDRGHPPAPLSVFPAVGQNAQLPGHWAYFSTISASAFGRSATAAKAAKPRANAST